jgi:hypothetical protein
LPRRGGCGTRIIKSKKYARVLLFHIEKMSCGAASGGVQRRVNVL